MGQGAGLWPGACPGVGALCLLLKGFNKAVFVQSEQHLSLWRKQSKLPFDASICLCLFC